MRKHSSLLLGTISILLVCFLAGCYSDRIAKNDIVPIGNDLYLVETGSENELWIVTTPPGATIPTYKTWKGKARSEREIIRYDILTQEITSLTTMWKPTPGMMVIVFSHKYVMVYEGDGAHAVHKHPRSQDQP